MVKLCVTPQIVYLRKFNRYAYNIYNFKNLKKLKNKIKLNYYASRACLTPGAACCQRKERNNNIKKIQHTHT